MTFTAADDSVSFHLSPRSPSFVDIDAIQLISNDTGASGSRRIVGVDPNSGQGGSLTLTAGGDIHYTPPSPDFVGIDSFTYTVSDGTSESTATVTLFSNNEDPIVMNDEFSFHPDPDHLTTRRIVDFQLTTNDTDGDGDRLFIEDVSGTTSAGGSVVLNAAGDVIYTPPAADFVGVDSFTYTVSDGFVDVTGTATVNLTNEVPIAGADSFSAPASEGIDPIWFIQLLKNDEDGDSRDRLEIVEVSPESAEGGTVILGSNRVLYTPPEGFVGVDTFTYTITDGFVETTGTVTVELTNEAPVIMEDSFIFGGRDVSSSSLRVGDEFIFAPGVIIDGVLNNDFDPDGNFLEIVDVQPTTASGLSVELNPDGSISLEGDVQAGQDSFTYIVSDGFEESTGIVNLEFIRARSDDIVLAITPAEFRASSFERLIPESLILANDIIPPSGLERVTYDTGEGFLSPSVAREGVRSFIDANPSNSDDGFFAYRLDRNFVRDFSSDFRENGFIEDRISYDIISARDPSVSDGALIDFQIVLDFEFDVIDPLSIGLPFLGTDSDNFLFGNNADDTILGGLGSDFLLGGAGNDFLEGLGDGNDTLLAAADLDILQGDEGDDTLIGGSGNDELYGGLDNDSLVAGEGDDTLNGVGASLGLDEIDQLVGGAGADTFVLGDERGQFYNDGFSAGQGTTDYALIADFELGVDTIQVSGLASDYVLGASPFSNTATDTAIFLDLNGDGSVGNHDELIAVVQNLVGVTVAELFSFV